ncbi:hypothetical protein ONE63_004648 [Megalurothrips usitatus]|uniref:UDP-galactose transporter senju n=1 Tax=Megalurothrips usitatus TaxID=439358 RepID=A0AAV7X6S8_9NEOP|nr:hypothetical protein ONE63_004648 [Megalurothrips usitatus]
MLSQVKWAELFPTKSSVVIFAAYVGFFTNQGILVRFTQSADNSYPYNTVTVVLLTDFIKLIITSALYCKDHPIQSLFIEVFKNMRVCSLYLVPAFLYSLYNNLAFISLSAFDPTTYYLLLQLRVALTGIVYQVIFKKRLSGTQWMSLILLTVGCMIKEMDFSSISNLFGGLSGKGWNFFLLMFQMSCSCFAGVYNEYLLKKESPSANIFIQNVFMYLNSIVCNIVMVMLHEPLSQTFSSESLSAVLVPSVIILMLNNAGGGITTSFFLRNLNSIMKTFTGAIELTCSALLCYVLFGIPIYLKTVISIATVSYATILYSSNPVSREEDTNKHKYDVEMSHPLMNSDSKVTVV